MAYNKTGLHIETTGGVSRNILDTATRLHTAGKPFALCVVIDDVGLANDLARVCRYVVFRSYPAGEKFTMDKMTSEAAARAHADEVWAAHQGAIANLDKRIYIQTRNEKGINQWDAYYEIRMMELAEAQGRVIGMAGDSVGTPDTTQVQWRIPALRRAGKRHAWVIHEYSAFINGQVSNTPLCDPNTRGYFGLRHRMLYASVSADARPLLLIGECGLSNGHPDSIEDLEGYNALLQSDGYVGGFAIWGYGATAPQYNANPQLPALEQSIMTH